MPNHCYQNVTVVGPFDMVQHLARELARGRFCDAVLPMPLEVRKDPEGWYNWRNSHWETKWDVCDVDGVEASHSPEEMHHPTPETSQVSFRCWTAWGPPIPVWDELVRIGCKVSAEYFCEMGNFEGEYLQGVNRSWIPEDQPETLDA